MSHNSPPRHRPWARFLPAGVLVIGAGALGAGLLAPPALAASTAGAAAALDSTGRTLVFTAAPGQRNDVTVTATASAGLATLTYAIDDVVPVTAGEGCAHPDAADLTRVSCAVPTAQTQDPYPALQLHTGDLADTVRYANGTGQAYYFARIDLGAGDDTLSDTGTVDGSAVLGGTGDDTLTTGPASTVLAGDGADTVHATGTATLVLAGAGDDTVTSTGEDAAVDGEAGDDHLVGGKLTQHLAGGEGADEIHGRSGDDFLYGGGGTDKLYGEDGDDSLYGGAGQDLLSGGAGRNILSQDGEG